MIQLYQFRPAFGLPNFSPFCLKLETWLKMAGLPYESVVINDPRQAPLGKLPFIKVDGQSIPDSTLCIAYLSRCYHKDLDAHLSVAQKAQSHLLTRLLEDHLYWALLYSRWQDERYWPTVRDTLFADMPKPVRLVVPTMIQQKIKRDLQGHGLAKHNPQQIYTFAQQDLATLATILGDNTYLLGDQPSTVDCIGFGVLAQMTLIQQQSPWPALVADYPNLRQYCLRIKQRYFA